MFRIDTFRLIKKTMRRFLSLFLIVLIGVAFMMGLMSNPTIMRKSVDKYNDEYNLQDIQIYSQYGFCHKDIEVLRFTEGVDKIFASRMVDVNCIRSNGSEIIARVAEINRPVNGIELTEGRMPANDNECVVLSDMNSKSQYKLGEHLRFYLEDSDLKDSLKYEDYLIVGYCKSPEYISKVLGTSNLKNQDLSLLVYVPNRNFLSEYYTTLFLTLDGSKELLSYTDEYKQFIDDNKYIVEDVALNQQNYLKDKIYDEYSAKLEEGKKEFEQKKQEGQAELDDAKRKLDEANIQIISLESTLSLLEEAVAKAEILANQNQGVQDASEYIQDWANSLGISTDAIYNQYFKDYAEQKLEQTKKAYNEVKWQLSSAKKQYKKGLDEYAEGVLKFNEEIEKAEIELRKAEQDLNDLPKAKWTILTRELHYSSYMYDSSCSQMQAIGYVMPFMFFLVAALVCLTTMARLIDEQRGQIGIYVALGYTKKQIIGKYVTYAFLASMIGGVLGIFIGQAMFPTIIYNTWRLLYDLPAIQMSFPPVYVIISLCSFSILMMLISAIVVNNSTSESPAALLRPKAPKTSKTILLEKVKFLWDRLSFTSKITARNLFRYKSRFFMTVIGVAGCTALLVLGWGIKDSIADVIKIQFGNIFGYDNQIYLENDHNIDASIDKLEDNLDNEIVVPFMSYTSKVYSIEKDNSINVLVFDKRDANEVLGLRKTDRKTPLKLDNSGIILSEKFAINNNIKKGDYILLESKQGLKESVKVADICEMYFQHYIFMSNDYYESIFDENVYNTNIGVLTNDSETLKQDAKELDDYVSIVDFSSMIDQFETMIEALDLIILVIIITAGSLAFVVIMNLSQVNISERVREIATLKVLGFHNIEVNNYIFKEILILTIIGAILGLPLGVVEHHFVMNVINMEMVMFGMNISVLSFTYGFVITIIFTIIVLFFMRKVLRNVDMIESLKSVE